MNEIGEFRLCNRLSGFSITYYGDEIIGVDLKYGMTKLYTIHSDTHDGCRIERIRVIGVDAI